MRTEFCKALISCFGGTILDKNNIVWKLKNGEWIGKRSVYTFDLRAVWLEDTTKENVRSWWCGIDANYNEIFTKIN